LFVIIAIIIMILAAISWDSFVPTTVRLGGPTDAELEAQSKAAIQKQLNQVMEQPTGSELNAINSQLTNQKTQTASSGEETAIKKQLIVPRASEI
ncbi:MAG: hypothetical protein WCK03_00270, partial [Candidatus Taylorbacteria bacterium]